MQYIRIILQTQLVALADWPRIVLAPIPLSIVKHQRREEDCSG